MLIPFTARYRLVSTLEDLALYNDKGIAWSKHTDAQRTKVRAEMQKKIEVLKSKIGASALPKSFLDALVNGDVATDLTGKYADLVKRHFEK